MWKNNGNKVIRDPYRWNPVRAILTVIIGGVIVFAIVMMMKDTGFVPSTIAQGFSRKTLERTDILRDLIHPDFSSKVIRSLCFRMRETLEIALIGTILAVIFSFPLSFVGAFNLMGGRWPQRGVFYTMRVLFNAVRAFEAFILLLVLATIFGYNAFAGILAIAIHSVGMLGKLYAEAIENVDPGPVEAIQAVGGSRLQVIFWGILPQVFPLFVGYSLYRFDINVRMTVIIGYIGVGGIGTLLLQYIQTFNYQKLSTAFIAMLIVVSLIDYLSTVIRKKFLNI